ncbi:MAG: hypothetical protein WCO56_25025 [Verrucomicrobiota bacterium]
MSQLLKRLYNNCDPQQPATAEQYVDTDAVRGDRDLTDQILAELSHADPGHYVCFLFSGHVGCGKSSELRHLADKCSSQQLLPVMIDVEEYIEQYDVTPTDILLAILAEFSSQLARRGIQLQDTYLHSRLQELKELLFSKVQTDGVGIQVALPAVTANFKTVLKRDEANRDKVRKALEGQTNSLRAEITRIFDDARVKLRANNTYQDFVLILDGLEKIQRMKGFVEGYATHREFFIERHAQLTGLGCHVIYTVPLALVISDGALLQQYYGSPMVLPMIKVENRNHHRCEPGYSQLKALVQKRLETGTLLKSTIQDDALEFLIKYSGGHVRLLMSLLRQASVAAKQPPIAMKDAEDALGPTIEIFGRMPPSYWDKLAALELEPNHQVDNTDDDIRKMLQLTIILEYRNGEGAADRFSARRTWYAVQPIVRELDLFKKALARQQTPAGA